jgi:quercetin dioxygenase-like cupin family protein
MPDLPAPRRIVTGHDDAGRSVVVDDGDAPASRTAADGATFHDMWVTHDSPATVSATEPEPIAPGELLGPPLAGTRVRICDMPPGTRSPMHRTESIDYGVVLSGTITLVLDDDAAVEVGPGELIVQRGTDHAWENRGNATVRMLFVLVAGHFDDALAGMLPQDAVMHDVD